MQGEGRTLVRLADDTAVPVERLKAGQQLYGGAKVAAVRKIGRERGLVVSRLEFGPVIVVTRRQPISVRNAAGESAFRSYNDNWFGCVLEAYKPPTDTPMHYAFAMILEQSQPHDVYQLDVLPADQPYTICYGDKDAR